MVQYVYQYIMSLYRLKTRYPFASGAINPAGFATRAPTTDGRLRPIGLSRSKSHHSVNICLECKCPKLIYENILVYFWVLLNFKMDLLFEFLYSTFSTLSYRFYTFRPFKEYGGFFCSILMLLNHFNSECKFLVCLMRI